LIALKQQEFENERFRMRQELNEFRQYYQKPELSRDFDLFDPDALKKTLPARLGDDDPRLTISGAQKFEGEDLSGKDRAKMQKEQQRIWLEQQIREKRQAEIDRKLHEKMLEDSLEARERLVTQMAMKEQCEKNKIQTEINEFNKRLTYQQEHDRQTKKREEEEDNLAEIYNHLTSDLLTENPDAAKSALGPHRKIAYMYKGMSPEELENLRRIQEHQKEEMRKRRDLEKHLESKWDQLAKDIDRTIVLKDRELIRRQR
jgi:hypothetical protein